MSYAGLSAAVEQRFEELGQKAREQQAAALALAKAHRSEGRRYWARRWLRRAESWHRTWMSVP